jgi:hypothetical protein
MLFKTDFSEFTELSRLLTYVKDNHDTPHAGCMYKSIRRYKMVYPRSFAKHTSSHVSCS